MDMQEEVVLARMAKVRLELDVLDKSTLVELKKVYSYATKSLMADVSKAKYKSGRIWTNTRLLAMAEEVQLMSDSIVGSLSNTVADSVSIAGRHSYKYMNNIVGWDGAVSDFNNVSLSKDQIKNLVTEQKLNGKSLKEWMGSALSPDIDSIKSEIQSGLIRGDGFSKVVNRLKKELTLTPENERNLESVVKTYTQSINVKAQQDVYNANSDLVKEVEWTAIMEPGNTTTGKGTCPRCMALDGIKWPLEEERPDCPLHVRCRCMLLPITKTWKELGFDIPEMEKIYKPWAVRDIAGRIQEIGWTSGSYADWWSTRSIEFQNNAVGPKRADLIRKGIIDFSEMVDSKGNLILIKDLVSGISYAKRTEEDILKSIKVMSAMYDKTGDMAKKTYLDMKTKLEQELTEYREAAIAEAKVPLIKDNKRKIAKTASSVRPVVEGMPTMEYLTSLVKPRESFTKNLEEMDKRAEELKEFMKSADMSTRAVISAEIKLNAIQRAKLVAEQAAADNELMMLAIKPPKGGSLRLSEGDKSAILYSKEFSKVVEDVESFFHPSIISQVPDYTIKFSPNAGTFHRFSDRVINISQVKLLHFIHEYAHAVEIHAKNGTATALEFLLRRIKGEKLTKIPGANNGMGWKDKFYDHYVGRDYNHDSHIATEIVSMGIERMATDPASFLLQDPDHFYVTLRFMWGDL